MWMGFGKVISISKGVLDASKGTVSNAASCRRCSRWVKTWAIIDRSVNTVSAESENWVENRRVLESLSTL
jgi:hypothetical protein